MYVEANTEKIAISCTLLSLSLPLSSGYLIAKLKLNNEEDIKIAKFLRCGDENTLMESREPMYKIKSLQQELRRSKPTSGD